MTSPAPLSISHENCKFECTYIKLRSQARRYLRREQMAYSMSPSVLVHEAWMALARSHALRFTDNSHYVRLVCRVMKNLLVDHARSKRALINGGALKRIEWKDASAVASQDDYDLILAIGDAMEQLTAVAPQLAALVELRYFSGFTESEVAQILGISMRTVRRQWSVARLRLLEILQSAGTPRSHSNA